MKHYPYIYLIGIGGIGMSALARWFHSQNKHVFGYDRTATQLTTQLIQAGMVLHFEDCVEAIPQEILQHKAKSLIIYTPAIPKAHRILRYLQTHHYAVYKRAAVLGMITQQHFTIAVAGTHGKTTTAAMIAHILYRAGKNMVAFLGGILQGYNTNLLLHRNAATHTVVVVEADEFDRSFLQLAADWSVVTAMDADHMDVYQDMQAVEAAFQTFMQQTAQKLTVQAQAAQKLCGSPMYQGVLTRYGLQDAPIRAENIQLQVAYSCFDYVSPAITLSNLVLTMPGMHNIENALAAIHVCLGIGSSPAAIRTGLKTFQGIKRHFEYILQRPDCIFIDDYAHHPVEITALLHAIRSLYPHKRITAIFQPHLYSRTKEFAGAFAQSLCLADTVFLLPIYPAREAPIAGVSSHLVLEAMPMVKKGLCEKTALIPTLSRHGLPEVLVTIGAGDISALVGPLRNFLLAALDK